MRFYAHVFTFGMMLAFVLGWALSSNSLSSTAAHAAASSQVKSWEYKTDNVSIDRMQGHLSEIGDLGWEVFAITVTQTRNIPQGHPIIVEKVEVTAKRIKMQRQK